LTRGAGLAGDAASAARAGYVLGYEKARATGDIEAMAEAALGLAATQTFGTVPGRVPAFLHEAYSLAQGEQRAQLAVALARAWAYGYDPARAARFAAEALAYAEAHDDPSLLAAALDAQLLVHWGPDDLDQRLSITARLEDTVAHVADAEPRMSAHLWRLTTALECLDLPAVRRQLRALDLLAAESSTARVRFFAASRRGMYALLTDDLDVAERALREVAAAGAEAGEADTPLIEHMLAAGIARQAGDVAALAREAATYEEFGVHEAVPWVVAEAALLWMAAGELDRARALLYQLARPDFSGIARDLDWLLIVAELTEVAVATGAERWRRRRWACWRPMPGTVLSTAAGRRLRVWSATTCTRPASCLAPATPSSGRPAPQVSTSGWAPRGGCAASRKRSRDSRRRWCAGAIGRRGRIPRWRGRGPRSLGSCTCGRAGAASGGWAARARSPPSVM